MNSIYKKTLIAIVAVVVTACATGNTPESKKKNAVEATNSGLAKIYEEHLGAKKSVANSGAYIVCTGSDSYLFAVSSGGGVCVLHEPAISYWRFATLGTGAGIGFKKVAFVYAFMEKDALKRFKESGVDAGARAEASAKYEDEGDQASANASVDTDGVQIYQVNLMGAAAQATVQGYKFWPTDFTDDVMQNAE
jgi:lipid-binding SYLF domain-containing protein